MRTRPCAECKAPLPRGVPDVFCPACALRRALGVGSPALLAIGPEGQRREGDGNWFMSCLYRIRNRSRSTGSQKITLASPEDKTKDSGPMTTGAPGPGDTIEDY